MLIVHLKLHIMYDSFLFQYDLYNWCYGYRKVWWMLSCIKLEKIFTIKNYCCKVLNKHKRGLFFSEKFPKQFLECSFRIQGTMAKTKKLYQDVKK